MEPVRPIKINLLETDRQSEQKPTIILVSLVVVLAILGLMGGMYAISLGHLHSEQATNDSLKERYGNYQKRDNVLQMERQTAEAIANKQKMIEVLEASQISYLDLMAEVEKASPEGIRLYNLDMEANKIIITGSTKDGSDLAVMLAGLRASPWFKKIKTVSISDEGKAGDGYLRFDIAYEWEVVRK